MSCHSPAQRQSSVYIVSISSAYRVKRLEHIIIHENIVCIVGVGRSYYSQFSTKCFTLCVQCVVFVRFKAKRISLRSMLVVFVALQMQCTITFYLI